MIRILDPHISFHPYLKLTLFPEPVADYDAALQEEIELARRSCALSTCKMEAAAREYHLFEEGRLEVA